MSAEQEQKSKPEAEQSIPAESKIFAKPLLDKLAPYMPLVEAGYKILRTLGMVIAAVAAVWWWLNPRWLSAVPVALMILGIVLSGLLGKHDGRFAGYFVLTALLAAPVAIAGSLFALAYATVLQVQAGDMFGVMLSWIGSIMVWHFTTIVALVSVLLEIAGTGADQAKVHRDAIKELALALKEMLSIQRGMQTEQEQTISSRAVAALSAAEADSTGSSVAPDATRADHPDPESGEQQTEKADKPAEP